MDDDEDGEDVPQPLGKPRDCSQAPCGSIRTKPRIDVQFEPYLSAYAAMKEFKGILPQKGGYWDQTSDVRVLLATIARVMADYKTAADDPISAELTDDAM